MRLVAPLLLAAGLVVLLLSLPSGRGGKLLPDLPERIDSLEIVNDSLDAVLRNEEGVWWIAGPHRERAEGKAVEALLGLLRSARWTGVRLAGEAPAERARITAAGIDLRLADPERPGGRVPVRRGDAGELLLADRRLALFLGLGAGAIRDRSALVFPAGRLDVLTIIRAEECRTIRRGARGEWRVDELDLRADRRQIGALLALLGRTRIHSFSPGPFREAADSLVVRLAWKGGEGTLRIGAAVEGTSLVICRDAGREEPFHLPRYAADSIRAHTERLVDRRLFAGDPLVAVSVRLAREDARPVLLLREREGWRLDGDPPVAADAPTVRAFLRNLARLAAIGVLPPEGAGPAGVATWSIAVDGERVAIEDLGGTLVARREGERGVLLLDPAARSSLEIGRDDLLGR